MNDLGNINSDSRMNRLSQKCYVFRGVFLLFVLFCPPLRDLGERHQASSFFKNTHKNEILTPITGQLFICEQFRAFCKREDFGTWSSSR